VNIALASDLHYEFHGPESHVAVPEGTDVLILAGDIATISTLPNALRHYAACAPHVLYVTGNHEFYGHEAADKVDDLIAGIEAECSNLKRLTAERGVVEIDGVTFAGDTLWFGNPDGLNQIYEKSLADFTAIRWRDITTAKWIAAKHAQAKQFFNNAKADVFISHHIPSEALITPKWARSPINRFFASKVFEYVTHPPKVWCYGHTHDSIDRVLGATRFLCNPKGYPHERKGVYEVKSFTIEV
jgi:predicted phosphodiesterase